MKYIIMKEFLRKKYYGKQLFNIIKRTDLSCFHFLDFEMVDNILYRNLCRYSMKL